MFSKLLGRKLFIATATVFLTACQVAPVHGPNNPSVSIQQMPDVWVDLTPYPKSPTGLVEIQPSPDTPSLMGSDQGQWVVYLSDHTIRQALTRWAFVAGWTFNDDFYEINADIPLAAEAVILERGSFKKAVQNLVEAVSLSEQPIRACFYENNVLRIINVNQSCDVRAR